MSLIRSFACATLILALSPAVTLAQYSGQSCDQLYYARNSIYKAAGLCFHTPRAIQTFGNAGCQYDNPGEVRLSGND